MSERKAFLIRVGIDSTYGGFVSPIFPDKSYVFVPFPNVWDSPVKSLEFSEIRTNSDIPLTDYLPKDGVEVKGEFYEHPENIEAHNDPEFKSNTYGELKRKKVIYSEVKDFEEGDYIVFYAGFYPCSHDFKYKNHTLKELQRKQRGEKRYYVFAFLELKYPLIDASNYTKYEDEIQNNAHYIGGDFERDDKSFILKGTDRSRFLENPIRIDGGLKGSNYMMTEEFSQYKLKNKENSGLNRSYCRLEESVIDLLT